MKFFGRFTRNIAGLYASFSLKFSNNFKKIQSGLSSFILKFAAKIPGVTKGEIFIRAYENGKLVPILGACKVNFRGQEAYKVTNIVTLSASTLLARLMKDPSEPAGGVTYFALGTGAPSWDKFSPPLPTDVQEALETEIERVSPTATKFIDPGSGLETIVATNIVDFDFDFSEAQAVGFLCEAGLFGGDATASLNSGTLITYKTFPVISKTASMQIAFTYRLTF
jgi:hypothetical protein